MHIQKEDLLPEHLSTPQLTTDLVCPDCKKDYVANPQSKRCDDCRKARARQYMRDYYRNNKERYAQYAANSLGVLEQYRHSEQVAKAEDRILERKKVCTTCMEHLPFSDFPEMAHSKDGHSYVCQKCLDRKLWAGTKVCSRCKEVKPKSDFRLNRSKKGRHLLSKCKRCEYEVEAATDKRKANRSRYRLAYYGLTPRDYHLLYETQNGACKICGRKEEDAPRGRLHIDHDHATGEVRGLLCHGCNTALGAFRDDPKTLARAVYYVRRVDYPENLKLQRED